MAVAATVGWPPSILEAFVHSQARNFSPFKFGVRFSRENPFQPSFSPDDITYEARLAFGERPVLEWNWDTQWHGFFFGFVSLQSALTLDLEGFVEVPLNSATKQHAAIVTQDASGEVTGVRHHAASLPFGTLALIPPEGWITLDVTLPILTNVTPASPPVDFGWVRSRPPVKRLPITFPYKAVEEVMTASEERRGRKRGPGLETSRSDTKIIDIGDLRVTWTVVADETFSAGQMFRVTSMRMFVSDSMLMGSLLDTHTA